LNPVDYRRHVAQLDARRQLHGRNHLAELGDRRRVGRVLDQPGRPGRSLWSRIVGRVGRLGIVLLGRIILALAGRAEGERAEQRERDETVASQQARAVHAGEHTTYSWPTDVGQSARDPFTGSERATAGVMQAWASGTRGSRGASAWQIGRCPGGPTRAT